tara:strand:+ start:7420 stop:7692 length:273 start_codon:yes stop_codon:yes gene_type:complete
MTPHIHFITDIQHPEEPDILTPFKDHDLLIQDEHGNNLVTVAAPDGGWTHELLEATNKDLPQSITDDMILDARLGGRFVGLGQFVGSTEI